jgi:hypothetical protein
VSFNIRTLSLADTQEFGVLPLIVSDGRQAAPVLSAGINVVADVELTTRP